MAVDINEMHDLVMPETPSWWPLAPGLEFLIVLLLWLMLCLSISFYKDYKAAAYRRAGVQLLEDVRTSRELSVLLKRVALVSFQRDIVASLYGREWVDFLHQSCAGIQMDELENTGEGELTQSLKQQAKRWIKEHKV